MKTLATFLVILAGLSAHASGAKDADTSLTTAINTENIFAYSPVTNLSILCGDGSIIINYRTGEVTLPKGVLLPEAARRFWLAVAEAFPDARREIARVQLNTLVLSDADAALLRDILKVNIQVLETLAKDAKKK